MPLSTRLQVSLFSLNVVNSRLRNELKISSLLKYFIFLPLGIRGQEELSLHGHLLTGTKPTCPLLRELRDPKVVQKILIWKKSKISKMSENIEKILPKSEKMFKMTP